MHDYQVKFRTNTMDKTWSFFIDGEDGEEWCYVVMVSNGDGCDDKGEDNNGDQDA